MTHGCIDGYSRVITFLQTGIANGANDVLRLFAQACVNLGLPSRVRCDRGSENINVGLFMTLIRGGGRSSVLAGKSVHNQRIERLWRDVACQVTDYFYSLFYELEDESLCDVNNDVHLHALRIVFLPIINKRMNEFRDAWNSHPLRTARNQTPSQLWISGMLLNGNSGHIATEEVFGNHPSVEERIEDALARFNLDAEPFHINQGGLQVPQPAVPATNIAVDRIRTAVTNMSDLKAQYKIAVDILQQLD